ncbi:hypothetical protein [Flavihumibacter profundi]|uniref:hypothetical protein n=1 Tax=Flavihumibacter profundi TaxID=2716883 RepID=UPI001CC6F0D7|nr:hypothetical protein [Flavihumibacter profundi]MBZ5858245.1 hypothetical protein [Flavihumibacter profundi]
MAMRKWIKWGIIAISGILLILTLSIGLWIRLRTVSAVQELVANLSDGKYALRASSIRVDPFHMKFNAKKIYIYPVHKGSSNSEFELKADSLSLELSHIFELLLFKKLNVDNFSIANPSLELRVYEKNDREKKAPVPLHQQVARIQTVFFEVLESLKVKKFRLAQGNIAYYPELNVSNGRYYLDNINLSIDNLHLLEKFTSGKRQNKAAIHLELLDPKIEYPDSSITVDLKHFDWNTKNRHFDITGLGFHKSLVTKGDTSGFELEDIELDSMNWNKLLTQGVVELGELKASRGSFTSNDFSFKKKVKDSLNIAKNGNLLDVIGPILIKRLSIHEIKFAGNTHTARGKETIQINGDQLEVENLVIDKSLKNKVELQELSLKVRAFMENDSSKTFQAGFDEVLIRKNNLTLKNYYLHSLKNNRLGENKIDVRELTLEELSIQDLINGKLKARELVLTTPLVHINLPAAKKKGKNTDWQKLQANIRKKLDIGIIRINNASVIIKQAGRETPLVKTDSFFAIIGSRNILRSKTLEEIFEGQGSFSMPKLAVRTPLINIDFQNAAYDKKNFHAASASGETKNGTVKFKLNNIFARDINPASIIHQKDSGLLRLLDIGNGDIVIRIPERKAEDNNSATSELVRTINSGPLKFHIFAKAWSLETEFDSIYIERLKKQEGIWTWQEYLLKGNNLKINHPLIKGNSGSFEFASNHDAVIYNSHWEINHPKLMATAQLPSMQVTNDIISTKKPLNDIQQISLKDPVITVLLKQSGVANPKGNKTKYTELPAISLQDPRINISKHKGDSIIEIAGVDGGKMAVGRMRIDPEAFATNSLELDLKNIVSNQEKYAVRVPYLKLHTGNITVKKDEPIQTNINALSVQDGRFDFHDSSRQLSLNGINTSIDKSFRLNTAKDSLKRLLTTLPHLTFHTNNLFYETGGRQISVDQLRVASDKKQISFDSLKWVGTISRDSFFKAAKVQKDFIQLHAGKSLLNGYKMVERGKDTVWAIEQFNLSNLGMLLERDKRFPADSINYRPLLTGMLQNLPLRFSMGKIILDHAAIRYNEISEKKGKEASIWFSDINATIGNVRNIDIRPTDSLSLNARAKLMDKGNLRLAFRESYTDSLQGFFMLARMGNMEFNALSPLLLPLVNIRVERGTIDSLWLKAKANDYLALGKMEMDYRNLKLSLLDDSGSKKKFTSFLINTLLKGKNDKTGMVYKERLRNKSMFNFWGKIALSGLLTNIGVQKNRKYAKKYKQQMKTLNLPPDLLEE